MAIFDGTCHRLETAPTRDLERPIVQVNQYVPTALMNQPLKS